VILPARKPSLLHIFRALMIGGNGCALPVTLQVYQEITLSPQRPA
jgi:hypothetical protein